MIVNKTEKTSSLKARAMNYKNVQCRSALKIRHYLMYASFHVGYLVCFFGNVVPNILANRAQYCLLRYHKSPGEEQSEHNLGRFLV